MNINTKYFGEITISEDEKIFFPSGLFGFPENKSYFLLSFNEGDPSQESADDLKCLQSVEDPSLAFVVVNPFAFALDYTPMPISYEDLKEIESTPESSLSFYAISVIHESLHDSTVNLKCPLAINPKNKKGKQVIFEGNTYSMRHIMWPVKENCSKESGSC